jgi:hypothetical protein
MLPPAGTSFLPPLVGSSAYPVLFAAVQVRQEGRSVTVLTAFIVSPSQTNKYTNSLVSVFLLQGVEIHKNT